MANLRNIKIILTDQDGQASQEMNGQVTQYQAPVITGVAFTPSAVPAAGGLVHVVVSATFDLPVTLQATPDVGTIANVNGLEFDWTIPAA